MKKIFYTVIALAAMAVPVFSQDGKALSTTEKVEAPAETIYQPQSLTEQPEFPGGQKALSSYIAGKIAMSESPTGEDMKVRCVATFVVDQEGSVTDIKVKGDPGYGIGRRIEEALKKSPKWKPGRSNGRAVRTSYALPVSINLLGESKMSPENRGYFETGEVDVMPSYPGGEKALSDYISTQIDTEKLGQNLKGSHTIPVKFIVQADGSIASIDIHSKSYDLDKEIARVLIEKVKYKPGTVKGKEVAILTSVTLSVTVSR